MFRHALNCTRQALDPVAIGRSDKPLSVLTHAGAIVACIVALGLALGPKPAASAQTACVPPPADMLGWWPFDGSGADLSGAGRTLDLNGGAGFATGLAGQALDLHDNGTQNAARPVDDPAFDFGASDFTVQVWVNFNTTSREQTLVEKFAGGGGPGWTLTKLDGNALHFYAWPSIVLYSPGLAIPTGAWHHVLIRRSGPQFDLFYDGSIVAAGSSWAAVPDTGMPLLVGKRNDYDGRNFAVDGRMDDVAIWARALTDTEVQALYDGQSGSMCQDNGPEIAVDHGAVAVDEGELATNGGTFADGAYSDDVSITASVGAVTLGSGTWSWSLATTDGPIQSQTVTVSADNGHGGVAEVDFDLTVANLAPAVGPISVPLNPVPVGAPVNVGAGFADPGTLDTHTASWDWDDGGSSAGSVSETDGAGTVAGSHAFATPGIYTVAMAVHDDDGDTGTAVAPSFVVVYDPNGGFVTGGGWIDSPAGAFVADASRTGKATFGFVAKYKPGRTTPDGNTEFEFRAGNLRFKSTSYEWLVVAGAKAQYKGNGTVNGSGDYRFMLTAIDGDRPGGGGGDKLRLRLWNNAGGGLVYDNQVACDSATDDADPCTALGGGSIVIHK